MGYANESRQGSVISDGVAAVSLALVADNLRLWKVVSPITVLRVGVLITTAVTGGPPVVDFDKRVTPGSDTGRVDQGVARLTFAAAADAVGKMSYKDVAIDLMPGDEVSFQVVTAGTAGAGVPFLEYVNRHEVPGNFPEMIKGT